MELILIIVLTITLIPAVIFTAGVLQVVLGLAFLAFFPGYALVAALFPRRNTLGSLERLALSLILSIAVVPMVSLILNYTTWGMRTPAIVGSISGLIVVSSLVALLRRRRLPKEVRFEPKIRLSFPRFGGVSRLDQVLLVVLCLVTLGAFGVLAHVLARPKPAEPFSEFYLLGEYGMMRDYPQEGAVGQPVTIVLGIINREHRDTTYVVEITIDGEGVNKVGPIQLSNAEQWEEGVSFIPTRVGPGQKVAFLLYKDDGPEPYLTLNVKLNVKEGA